MPLLDDKILRFFFAMVPYHSVEQIQRGNATIQLKSIVSQNYMKESSIASSFERNWGFAGVAVAGIEWLGPLPPASEALECPGLSGRTNWASCQRQARLGDSSRFVQEGEVVVVVEVGQLAAGTGELNFPSHSQLLAGRSKVDAGLEVAQHAAQHESYQARNFEVKSSPDLSMEQAAPEVLTKRRRCPD